MPPTWWTAGRDTSWATDDEVHVADAVLEFKRAGHLQRDRSERGHSLRTARRRLRGGALERRRLGAVGGWHEHRSAPVPSAGQAGHRVACAAARDAGVGEPGAELSFRYLPNLPMRCASTLLLALTRWRGSRRAATL